VRVTTSVNGGMRITESAKLIFRVKKNGTRKKTSRKRSGGRMMSQRHAVFDRCRMVVLIVAPFGHSAG
jgi:hypothetical protein